VELFDVRARCEDSLAVGDSEVVLDVTGGVGRPSSRMSGYSLPGRRRLEKIENVLYALVFGLGLACGGFDGKRLVNVSILASRSSEYADSRAASAMAREVVIENEKCERKKVT